MRRDEALALLSDHLDELRTRFGVASLAVFGSVARDEARPDSDVDLLVDFEGPVGFDQFMGLKLHLEELFGRPVNIVTPETLKPRLRRYVEREAVRVA